MQGELQPDTQQNRAPKKLCALCPDMSRWLIGSRCDLPEEDSDGDLSYEDHTKTWRFVSDLAFPLLPRNKGAKLRPGVPKALECLCEFRTHHLRSV